MEFNSSKLSNQLPVVTLKMPSIGSVAINLLVKVGARYEHDQELGLSHFLEHMAFKGTTSRSARQIAQEFDAIGGQFNAYTSKEFTAYYAKVLPKHVDTAMDILADIILNSTYLEEEITKEAGVIAQEIAQTQDDPSDLGYEKLMELTFAQQQLGKSILGTYDSINAFRTADFKAYVAKHYLANNMVLSAAGNVDHGAFAQKAEAMFASVAHGDAPAFAAATYMGGGKVFTNKEQLEQSFLYLGYKGIPYTNLEEIYAMKMMSLLLGGGMSSRLFQKVREEMALAYDVGSFDASFGDVGIFGMYAGTSHDKVNAVIAAVRTEAQRLGESVSDAELERAKSQVEVNLVMAAERNSSKCEEIARNYAIFGRYIPLEEVLERLNAVDKNAIVAMAQRIFVAEPTISVVGAERV